MRVPRMSRNQLEWRTDAQSSRTSLWQKIAHIYLESFFLKKYVSIWFFLLRYIFNLLKIVRRLKTLAHLIIYRS